MKKLNLIILVLLVLFPTTVKAWSFYAEYSCQSPTALLKRANYGNGNVDYDNTSFSYSCPSGTNHLDVLMTMSLRNDTSGYDFQELFVTFTPSITASYGFDIYNSNKKCAVTNGIVVCKLDVKNVIFGTTYSTVDIGFSLYSNSMVGSFDYNNFHISTDNEKTLYYSVIASQSAFDSQNANTDKIVGNLNKLQKRHAPGKASRQPPQAVLVQLPAAPQGPSDADRADRQDRQMRLRKHARRRIRSQRSK